MCFVVVLNDLPCLATVSVCMFNVHTNGNDSDQKMLTASDVDIVLFG